MKGRWLGFVGAAFIVAGTLGLLVGVALLGSGTPAIAPSTGTGTGATVGGFASNGERIFYTGVGHDGAISVAWAYRSGFPGMMGTGMMGQIGCVTCHGADGRGRVMRMIGPVIEVPDIRYSTLTSPHQDTSGTTPGWTDAQISTAVRRGVEPDGKALDAFMPKWEMDDTDMRDVLDYLKELSRR
jgi:hypothetical protein